MIKLLDNSKVSLFEYLFLLCIIIYAGSASALTRQIGDIRTIGNLIPLVLSIIFAIYKRIRIQKELFFVIGAFSLYSILVIIATGSSHYFAWQYSRWLMFFFITYTICKGYDFRFVALTETILFHLAIISIIGWAFLLIIPGPFTNFISSYALEPFNDNERYTSSNILIYTVILSSITDGPGDWYLFIRNSGFAWEPGAFSCFMCLGIAFNALRTNLKFKKNLPLIVFLIALISTQSTTGYCVFGLMITVWLFANKKVVWGIILIPIVLYFIGLPFIGDKLAYLSENFTKATLSGSSVGSGYGRLLSFKIMWDEFLLHPLLGYGYAESIIEQHEIQTWSGIGRLLAQYGFIMTSVFMVLLWNSAKCLNKFFCSSNWLMIPIVIIGMMVSYMSWIQPFYMAVWMFCIFTYPQKKVQI